MLAEQYPKPYTELTGLEEVYEVIAGEPMLTLIYCSDTQDNRERLNEWGTPRTYYKQKDKLNITSMVWSETERA